MIKIKEEGIPFKCSTKNSSLNNNNLKSVIKNTYINGLSYFLSAKRLAFKKDRFKNQEINYMHIVEANTAFSIELFLKTILYKENGKKVKGHSLLELFKKHEYVYDEYYDCYICQNNANILLILK